MVEAGDDGSASQVQGAMGQEGGEGEEGGAGEEDVELVAGAGGWGGGRWV